LNYHPAEARVISARPSVGLGPRGRNNVATACVRAHAVSLAPPRRPPRRSSARPASAARSSCRRAPRLCRRGTPASGRARHSRARRRRPRSCAAWR